MAFFLLAGWGKLTGTGWIDGGSALLGFWQRAVAIPAPGRLSISFYWYRTLLPFLIENYAETWFGRIIALGETATMRRREGRTERRVQDGR